MSLGKITEGKLNYEFYWEFLTLLAERMAENKHKYKPYSWKQPIDIEELKQAYWRHTLEIMKGNYDDEGHRYQHIGAATANLMMIYYQLKQEKVESIDIPTCFLDSSKNPIMELVKNYPNDHELGSKIRELVK